MRTFIERHVAPFVEDWERERLVPREPWLEAGRQGFLALSVPEEFGGAGVGDHRFQAAATEEFAKIGAIAMSEPATGSVAAPSDPDAGSRGISLFVVERKTPAFERGRKLDKIGLHGQDTAELSFTDARIPAENLLGTAGRGLVHLMERLRSSPAVSGEWSGRTTRHSRLSGRARAAGAGR